VPEDNSIFSVKIILSWEPAILATWEAEIGRITVPD
jgi:hypothetical protein